MVNRWFMIGVWLVRPRHDTSVEAHRIKKTVRCSAVLTAAPHSPCSIKLGRRMAEER